jgi:ribosomal protein L18E
LAFSQKAIEKILGAGGTVISIPDLVRLNPKGSEVRVIV